MARPDEEEIEKTKAETGAALGLMVNSKIAAQQPKNLPQQPGAPTYIKYTPTQQGPQYNSGAAQRIIKMQVGIVSRLHTRLARMVAGLGRPLDAWPPLMRR